jgi:hypothetical protein
MFFNKASKKLQKKDNHRTKVVSGSNVGLVTDPLVNDERNLIGARAMVQLLLSAYCNIDSLEYQFGMGSEQDPKLVQVQLLHDNVIIETKYKFRQPVSVYLGSLEEALKIAVNVLTVYGRSFLLIFPKDQRFLTTDEIINSLVFWTMLALEDSWVQHLKHFLLVNFARAEKQEEPVYVTCHSPYVFRGTFGRNAFRKTFKSGRSCLIWRNTVLQGIKKGMPTVSPQFIENALKKHSNLLRTNEDSTSDFIHLVEDVSRLLFGDIKVEEVDMLQSFSMNATVEKSKGQGGALAQIGGLDDDKLLSGPTFLGMGYTPKTGVIEIRTNKFDTLIDEYRTVTHNRKSLWKVEIIREPLKVRTITKGQTHMNGVWSDLQKKLLHRLWEYPCFRLTAGGKVEDEYMFQGRLEKGLPDPFVICEDWGYASGDFQGATDSIYRDVMHASIQGISDELLKNLFANNLSNGIISYTDICKRLGIEPLACFEQLRGQLMGSIISFVFLCTINACTMLYASEVNHFKIFGPNTKMTLKEKLQNLPCLINGDDILFKSPNREFYEHWLEAIALAGFIPSVGKNYFSKNFSMVNSRYMRHGKDPIPYVNMGIIFGRKKGEDSRDEAKSFREKASFLPGYFRDLWKDFKHVDRELRSEMISYVLKGRKDVLWTGLSSVTLGLHHSNFGSIRFSVGNCRGTVSEHWRDLERLSRTKAQTGLRGTCEGFTRFPRRKPIDTDWLRSQRRLVDEDRAYKSLHKLFWSKQKQAFDQQHIDHLWEVSALGGLIRNTKISNSFVVLGC